MHIDGALFYIDSATPDPVQKLLSVEGPFRVAHEEFEEPKFRGTNVDIVSP